MKSIPLPPPVYQYTVRTTKEDSVVEVSEEWMAVKDECGQEFAVWRG